LVYYGYLMNIIRRIVTILTFKYRHLRVHNQHVSLNKKCILEIIILHIILSISEMVQFNAMID